MKLTIVDKLCAINTPEARDAEQALRHVKGDPLLGAEQRNRRPPKYSVPVKPKAAKQVAGFQDVRSRLVALADPVMVLTGSISS